MAFIVEGYPKALKKQVRRPSGSTLIDLVQPQTHADHAVDTLYLKLESVQPEEDRLGFSINMEQAGADGLLCQPTGLADASRSKVVLIQKKGKMDGDVGNAKVAAQETKRFDGESLYELTASGSAGEGLYGLANVEEMVPQVALYELAASGSGGEGLY
eukprot:gene11391-16930_t